MSKVVCQIVKKKMNLASGGIVLLTGNFQETTGKVQIPNYGFNFTKQTLDNSNNQPLIK
jgi:hypothetical protein